MPTIRLSDIVRAPVQEVFSFVSELSKNATHNEDVLSASQLTEGPVGKGTRFEMEMKGMGKAEVEVAEYSEPDESSLMRRHQSSAPVTNTGLHPKATVPGWTR